MANNTASGGREGWHVGGRGRHSGHPAGWHPTRDTEKPDPRPTPPRGSVTYGEHDRAGR
jgi:hypothetical protein